MYKYIKIENYDYKFKHNLTLLNYDFFEFFGKNNDIIDVRVLNYCLTF